MKRTLFLACLLLVAGPVYAEPDLTPGKSTHWEYSIPVSKERYACLARMEEALKVIEPWLGYTYKDDTSTADFKKAKALFYAVKQECWSKP